MKSKSKNLADRVCNLECVKDEPKAVEFVGPVKIVLVDPSKKDYKRRSCGSAFIAMANLMMGACNITVLYFTLAFKLNLFVNLHVLLCTIGFQLCFPSAILLINKLNGAGSALRTKDRRFQHMILQLLGLVCGGVGTALSILHLFNLHHFKLTNLLTFHAITGVAACGFAVLAVFTGLIIYCTHKGTFEDVCKCCHMTYGFISYILSSMCFISGLLKPAYSNWVPLPEMRVFPIIFCVFITVVVVVGPVFKGLKKCNL